VLGAFFAYETADLEATSGEEEAETEQRDGFVLPTPPRFVISGSSVGRPEVRALKRVGRGGV